MLSADASVFVPWCPTQQDLPKDVIDWSCCGTDDSTTVPSLASTAAGDMESMTNSPFWDLQDTPNWDVEQEGLNALTGLLPESSPLSDGTCMPQFELEPGVGYMGMGLGEFGEDMSFQNWIDPSATCCPTDVDPSTLIVPSDLVEEANMDFEAIDDPMIAAAAAMGWASSECLGLASPECMGLASPDCLALTSPECLGMEDPGIGAHLLNIRAPFASSCELARKIAPRPEGHGDDPLRICVAGDKLDGSATLAPVEIEELQRDDQEFYPLDKIDFDDYVRKVPNDGRSLVCERPEATIIQELGECLPEVSTARETEERRFLDAAEHDPKVSIDTHSSQRISSNVGPEAAVRGTRSQNEIGPDEAVSPEATALGTFDGFLFSEPGKVPITERHEA